jgi:hypothetical protein
MNQDRHSAPTQNSQWTQGPLRLWVRLVVVLVLLRTPCLVVGQIPLGLTARVDTTQADTKAVYRLLAQYLNSRPDSLYANPNWNAAEVNAYFTQRHEQFDFAASFLFFDLNAKRTFATYKPTVLSIAPVGPKYVARVLLYAENPPKWVTDSKWNPPFILRYYAARDATGQWRLENTWSNLLGQWKQHKTPWVTFHYPPTLPFDLAKGARASAFCDSLVTLLHLTDAKPFDFYVMNSEEELGQLFNLDYWLAYNTGFTRKDANRTFSAYGREQHLHEFVHMLYHPVKNYFLAEGVATYFGGVDGYTPYSQTLQAVVADLVKNHPTVTFKDLYANRFKYPLNSNPRYAAGALVYELVHTKAGVAGFRQLEESDNTYESFVSHFAAIMHLRSNKADAYLNNALRNYQPRKRAKN